MNRRGFGWRALLGTGGRLPGVRLEGGGPRAASRPCHPCGRGTRPDGTRLPARRALTGCSGPLRAGPALAPLCGSQPSPVLGALPAVGRARQARRAGRRRSCEGQEQTQPARFLPKDSHLCGSFRCFLKLLFRLWPQALPGCGGRAVPPGPKRGRCVVPPHPRWWPRGLWGHVLLSKEAAASVAHTVCGWVRPGAPAGNPEVSKHRPLAPATHQGGPERSTLTFRGFRSHLGSVPQTGFRGTLGPEAARGNDFRGQIGSEPLHVLLSEGRSPGQCRGARASSVLPVDSPWKGREPALCPRWVQRDPLPALGLARGLSGGWAPCCSASPSGTGAGGASAPSVGAPFRPCGRITEWGAGALSRPELEVRAVTMALQTCLSSRSWSLGRLGTRGVPHPVQGG